MGPGPLLFVLLGISLAYIPVNVSVGFMFQHSKDSLQAFVAGLLAVEFLNGDSSLVVAHGQKMNISLRILVADLAEDEVEQINKGRFQVYMSSRYVSAVVGPGTAHFDVQQSLAFLSGVLKQPIISYSATNAELSDDLVYPYIIRNCATDRLFINATTRLFSELEWSRIFLVTDGNDFFVDVFYDSFTDFGLEILSHAHVFAFNPWKKEKLATALSEVDAALDAIVTTGARVIVLHFSKMSTAQTFLFRAGQRGMLGKEKSITYEFVGIGTWTGSRFMALPNCNQTCADNLYLASKGILGVSGYRDRDIFRKWQATYWNPFVSAGQLKKRFGHALSVFGFDVSDSTAWDGMLMDPIVPNVFSSLYAVAFAMQKVCQRFPTHCARAIESYFDNHTLAEVYGGSYLQERMFGSGSAFSMLREVLIEATDFPGPGGNVHFSENGDLQTDLELTYLSSNGEWEQYGRYFSANNSVAADLRSIEWPGGKNAKPLDYDTYVISDFLQNVILYLLYGLVCFTILLFGFLMFHWKGAVMRFASQPVTILLLLSCGFICVNVFLMRQNTTHLTCQTHQWISSIMTALPLVASFARSYRIHRILNNSKMRRINMRDPALLGLVLALLVPSILVCFLWWLVDPLTVQMKQDVVDPGRMYEACGSDYAALFGLLEACVLMVMFVAGVWVIRRVKKAPSHLNHSWAQAFFLLLWAIIVVFRVFTEHAVVMGQKTGEQRLISMLLVNVGSYVSVVGCLLMPLVVKIVRHGTNGGKGSSRNRKFRLLKMQDIRGNKEAAEAVGEGADYNLQMKAEVDRLEKEHLSAMRSLKRIQAREAEETKKLICLRVEMQDFMERWSVEGSGLADSERKETIVVENPINLPQRSGTLG